MGRLLRPLLKIELPLKRNVFKPLAKSALIALGLIAGASSTNGVIQKKMFGSGTSTLIISNKEMNIMKIIKSPQESGLLKKDVNETIKNEVKKQNGRFLRMLIGALGASLLENLLTGKGTIRAGEATITAGEDTIRAGQNF